MALLDNDEFDYFCGMIASKAGVRPPPRKRGSLAQKLDPLLEQLGLNTAAELIRLLEASGSSSSIYGQTIESLLAVDGKFFKGYGAYRYLRETVMPEVLRHNATHKSINIWSAGCGMGEEPYSIAMTVRHAFPELEDWDVKIYGTDNTQQSLEKAQTGLYADEDIAPGVPADMVERSFEKLGQRWMVKPEDRAWVTFKQLNLMNEWQALPTFDIVFLRDVLLYFPVQAKNKILERLLAHLTPTSFVFLGPREKPPNKLHSVMRLVTDPKINCYQVSEEFNAFIDDVGSLSVKAHHDVSEAEAQSKPSIDGSPDNRLTAAKNPDPSNGATTPAKPTVLEGPAASSMTKLPPSQPDKPTEQPQVTKAARRPSLAQIKKAREKSDEDGAASPTDISEMMKIEMTESDQTRAHKILSDIYLFRDLPKGLVQEITNRLELFQFPAGDRMIRQGQQGEAFFILFDGHADVTISRGLLRRGQTVAKLKAGDIFGEMSIIMDQPCNADIVASGSVRVLAASRKLFEWLVNEHEEFAAKIREIITERTADTAVKLKMKNAAPAKSPPTDDAKPRTPSAHARAAAKSGVGGSTQNESAIPNPQPTQAHTTFEQVTKLSMTPDDFHHLNRMVRNIYLFRDLKAGELEDICSKLQLYGFPDQHPVIKHGDDGSAFYIIYSGMVRIMGKGTFFKKSPELALLGPGEVFGEMSLILERPCSANVIAQGDVRAFMVSRALFDYLFEENASFAATVNAIAIQRRADTAIKMS
ncbi:MAG: CheR family methyltransferase [Myxococcota bacterium]|nr:CheR family methyltransferase [Myxococcota bacterium]